MPELPDLARFKEYFDATSLTQEIARVRLENQRMLKNTTLPELKTALVGQFFLSTRQHGKWLFARLDSGNWLVLHFGMTGSLLYFQDEEKKPDYGRLLIFFKNGYCLAYLSVRKLGELRIIKEVDPFLQAKELGPDARKLDLDQFKSLLEDRQGMIKSALMDQGLLAGIGNVYSDEILFQARIHPRTPVQELSEIDVEEIFFSMEEVLETTIEKRAEPAEYPEEYLTQHRGIPGQCPRCRGELEKIQVSGRSAYYCPECQQR